LTVSAWLDLVYQRGFRSPDPVCAARLLDENPGLGAACPFAVGDPAGLAVPEGPFGMPPLVAVTFSSLIRLERFAPALRRCAELMLDAGADVDRTWTDPMFPDYRLSALYGAAGLNHDAGMTRLLLARGANPNDGESLYHSLEGPDLVCTRLLLDAGADPAGSNALCKVLDYDNLEGLRLLLERGADPNERRPLLHAIRRRRSAEHVRELLKAGTDPAGAYRLAAMHGLTEVAALLPAEALTDSEAFIAACARGDRADAAARQGALPFLEPGQLRFLPDLAEAGCSEAVKLMVELGWPVDTPGGDWKASALNIAVFRGDADLARFLLAHGADWRVRHGYGDNVAGTLSFVSRNRPGPGWVECARILIEGGMPVPDAGEYEFSPEVAAYFDGLSPGPSVPAIAHD
jgi:ankyrin repeat protein